MLLEGARGENLQIRTYASWDVFVMRAVDG